jgi:hypothetical protein
MTDRVLLAWDDSVQLTLALDISSYPIIHASWSLLTMFDMHNRSATRDLVLFAAISALSVGCIWLVANSKSYREWRQRRCAIRALERYGMSVGYREWPSTPGFVPAKLQPEAIERAWDVGVPWSAQYVDVTKVLPHLKELHRQGHLQVVQIFVSRHKGSTPPTPMRESIELLRKELPGVAVVEWFD